MVALLSGAAVAVLPYATPFLLAAFGERAALLVVSAVGTLAVALPLALRESPVSDGGAAPRRLWVTRRNVVLAFTGLLSLALVHNTGNTAIALLGLALVFPVLIGAQRFWQARHDRVERRLWRQPLAPELRWYRLQVVNQWLLLALIAATMVTGAYDFVRTLLPASGYRILFDVAFVAGLVGLAALATIPVKGVRLATNVLVLTCSIFLAGQIVWIYRAPVDPITVSSPVSGEWYVVQGGRAELVNGHNIAVAQDYALDIVQEVDGRTHTGDSKVLANYYAWGEPLLAPADGMISTVIDTFPDQPIGSVDRENAPGNQVVIDIGSGKFVAYAHIQSGSITISVGQRVRRGQLVGLVGNSGNSDLPHLHIQAQNNATFNVNRPPAGLATYPMLFDDVQVRRGNQVLGVQPADLRRGDRFAIAG